MRDIRPNKPNRHKKLPPIGDEVPDELDLYDASEIPKHRIVKAEHAAGRSSRTIKRAPAKIEPKPPGEEPVADEPPKEPHAKPRFTGSAVEVSTVDVPAPAEIDARSDANKRPIKDERPLFAKTALKKVRRARVGASERRILLIVFSLVLVMALGAAIIFLPTAEITLRLRTAPLLADESLTVGPTTGSGDSVVPGTAFVREVALEGSVPVENKEMIGEKASGVVSVVNRTVDEQRIKEQSRLVTDDGTLFYMQRHAIVPPNSRASVLVEAAEAGEGGNIEPGRLNFAALDEGSQTLVFAEVEAALTGGSGETISVVSEADLHRAREAAAVQAKGQAEGEIRNELPEGWTLLDESWTREFVDFGVGETVGDKVPTVNYNAQVAVRVMGFEQGVLEEQLREKLESALDEEFMLFPGNISYTKRVENVDWEDARVTLAARVTHSTIPRLSLDTLRQKLAGRSLEEAQEYLEGLPGVRSATMSVWPFWVQSIPRIEKRISLNLEPDRQP